MPPRTGGAVPAPDAFDRAKRAVELRLAGVQYADIGEQLGVSKQRAWTIVHEALVATLAEPADKLRAVEVARLDRLTRALWARALGQPDRPGAHAPDPIDQDRAVLRLVQISDRRARLLGLDAPTEITATETAEDRAARLADRVREWKANALDAPAHELGPVNGNGNGTGHNEE